MKSHVCFALVLSAVSIASANAEPLSLEPDRYGAYARSAPPTAPRYDREPMVQAPRYAAASNDMGGGFIEFLFGGGGGGGARTGAPRPPSDIQVSAVPYGAQPEPMPMRDAPARAIDPRYAKQIVPYAGQEKPGTVIIDTPNRFLFLVQDNGTALRYGIGVGRPGFTWAGAKTISAKKEWPDWTPPPEMLQRQPDLPSWMAGGPQNPLGARAMYLGSSLYRIHGSNEPWTIGQAVSSGCIRMRNEDVIDLYERVKIGTKVMVI